MGLSYLTTLVYMGVSIFTTWDSRLILSLGSIAISIRILLQNVVEM